MMLLAPVLASCSSMSGLRRAPLDEGEVRLFRDDIVRIRDAARGSMINAGLRITDDEPFADGWIIGGTTTPPGVGIVDVTRFAVFGDVGPTATEGAVVRLLVRPRADSLTSVRIIARTRAKPDFIGAQDYWASRVFERLQEAIDRLTTYGAADSGFVRWRLAAMQALQPGSVVRVLRRDSVFTGPVVGVDSGATVLLLGGGFPIALELIDSVWVQRESATARGLGAIVGMTGGAVAGAALVRGTDDIGTALAGVIGGGVVGAAVGSAVGAGVAHHWRRYFP